MELVRSEIEEEPIMCGEFITKEKVCDKWLGDMFHQDGLAASVVATIKEREPKVKGAFYEAAAIVDDWRAQCIGGFRSALDLWELVILPTLMYNSEMLVNIPKVAEETLEDLQSFFVRLILRVPQGTPKVSLLFLKIVFILKKVFIETMHYNQSTKLIFAFTSLAEGPDFAR